MSEYRLADAERGLCHVFVRDLDLNARIGVYQREKTDRQRIRVNVDLAVEEAKPGMIDDNLAHVVSYEPLVLGIRELVASGHMNLVETLAERIASLCLVDRRVRSARIRIEKLDIFADAGAVGVEIERRSKVP
jgi:dihydroneopterin aldolase